MQKGMREDMVTTCAFDDGELEGFIKAPQAAAS